MDRGRAAAAPAGHTQTLQGDHLANCPDPGDDTLDWCEHEPDTEG